MIFVYKTCGVVICADRAGIVGNDGETHQGIFDLSFLNTIPNINIMAPKDFKELEDMLEYATNLNVPVAIRYPRGVQANEVFSQYNLLELGKAEILKVGNDVTIIAIGKMVSRAMEVAELVKQSNINVEVINARFIKPIDEQTILQSVQKTKRVFTIEDNIVMGGLGDTVLNVLSKNNLAYPVIKLGYPDEFIRTCNYYTNRKTIWIRCGKHSRENKK